MNRKGIIFEHLVGIIVVALILAVMLMLAVQLNLIHNANSSVECKTNVQATRFSSIAGKAELQLNGCETRYRTFAELSDNEIRETFAEDLRWCYDSFRPNTKRAILPDATPFCHVCAYYTGEEGRVVEGVGVAMANEIREQESSSQLQEVSEYVQIQEANIREEAALLSHDWAIMYMEAPEYNTQLLHLIDSTEDAMLTGAGIGAGASLLVIGAVSAPVSLFTVGVVLTASATGAGSFYFAPLFVSPDDKQGGIIITPFIDDWAAQNGCEVRSEADR